MIGDWWLVAVGSGWQLAVGRCWRLAVGGWRRLVAVGGWWSLRVVPQGNPKQKKNYFLKDPPGSNNPLPVICAHHIAPIIGVTTSWKPLNHSKPGMHGPKLQFNITEQCSIPVNIVHGPWENGLGL